LNQPIQYRMREFVSEVRLRTNVARIRADTPQVVATKVENQENWGVVPPSEPVRNLTENAFEGGCRRVPHSVRFRFGVPNLETAKWRATIVRWDASWTDLKGDHHAGFSLGWLVLAVEREKAVLSCRWEPIFVKRLLSGVVTETSRLHR
jgi:hypothetical protein